MKKFCIFNIIVAACLIIFIFSGCKKDEDEITSVTDAEGNEYPVVKIGEQYWMAENLRVTKTNDGVAISNITDNDAWGLLTTPAYCWYANDPANKNSYGALYNWYTVNTAKLCPSGWHIPSDNEWVTLEGQLGGSTVAGGKMKETGTTYWNAPNTGATNESKFNARGSGVRLISVGFNDLKNLGLWWTSSTGENGAWFRYVNNQNTDLITQGYNKKNGLSVRCIKD